jgi:outer membrane protein OmpA-like peptidoglycan-associated protein
VDYDHSIDLGNTDDPETWNNRSECLVKLYAYEAALQGFAYAMNIDENYIRAKHNHEETMRAFTEQQPLVASQAIGKLLAGSPPLGFNGDQIADASKATLDAVVQLLFKLKSVKLLVSEQQPQSGRAEAVLQYLSSKHLDSARLGIAEAPSQDAVASGSLLFSTAALSA